MKWRCGVSGRGVMSLGGVSRGGWAATLVFPYRWLFTISVFLDASRFFPYNWLLVICVFPRAKLMFFSYFSFLGVLQWVLGHIEQSDHTYLGI